MIRSARRNEKAPVNGHGRAAAGPRVRVRRGWSHITIDGVLYVMLMLFIFVCAMNTSTNLLYLVFSVMLAALLVGWVVGHLNMRRVGLERRYPAEFFAGRPLPAHLVVHNGKARRPSYALRLHDTILGPVGHAREQAIGLAAFVAEVPPRGTATVEVELPPLRRGLYRLDGARIVSRFPFGVVERVRNVPGTARLLVLPRLLPAMTVLPFVPRALGEIETDRRGVGDDLFGVRDYQAGDPARLIHWKHSARGQGIKVKEFEHQEARGFRLRLDTHAPSNPPPSLDEDFEQAVSLAASLARLLIGRGAETALWTPLGNVPLDGGQEHLMRILRALAHVQLLPPDAPSVPPAPVPDHVEDLWIVFHAQQADGARRGRAIVDARRIRVVNDPLESGPRVR